MRRSLIATAALVALLGGCTTYQNYEARDVFWQAEGVGDDQRFVRCFATRFVGHGEAAIPIGTFDDVQIVERDDRTQILQTVSAPLLEPRVVYFLDVIPTSPSGYRLEYRTFDGQGRDFLLDQQRERVIDPCLNTTKVIYEAQKPAE